MKHRLRISVAALLLVAAMLCSLSACASKAPPLSQIYDTVVALVERSYAANDLLYGYGLPTWGIDSEYAELHYVYNDNEYVSYESVSEYSPYLSISAIREELESVYSQELLETYATPLFDGFFVGDGLVRAQFYEDNEWIYQSYGHEPLVTWQRIYDYSTMEIVSPSRADYVTVRMDSHLEGDDTILPVEISIIFENGAWKLDTPTY